MTDRKQTTDWVPPRLDLPARAFDVRSREGRTLILDPQRKKWVVLTPEEWVRLHVVQFLIHERNVPSGLIAVEAELEYEGYRRRADVVVYDRRGRPALIVECKAAHVPLTQEVIDQVARYNRTIGAAHVLVTNGLEHYVYRLGAGKPEFLADVPDFDELAGR